MKIFRKIQKLFKTGSFAHSLIISVFINTVLLAVFSGINNIEAMAERNPSRPEFIVQAVSLPDDVSTDKPETSNETPKSDSIKREQPDFNSPENDGEQTKVRPLETAEEKRDENAPGEIRKKTETQMEVPKLPQPEYPQKAPLTGPSPADKDKDKKQVKDNLSNPDKPGPENRVKFEVPVREKEVEQASAPLPVKPKENRIKPPAEETVQPGPEESKIKTAYKLKMEKSGDTGSDETIDNVDVFNTSSVQDENFGTPGANDGNENNSGNDPGNDGSPNPGEKQEQAPIEKPVEQEPVEPAISDRGPSGSVNPPYPIKSRERNEEGTVVVEVEILPDGSAGNVSVVQPSGYDRLDRAAVKEAQTNRFTPAVKNGRPVAARIRFKVNFRLEG